MTAAIFPLDTSQPWTFNGVTYSYDATEDRWFVISSTATDQVIQDISTLNSTIDTEIENRTLLIDAATSKNNDQDAAIIDLSQRVDAIGSAAGAINFKGRFNYVLEKTVEACTAAYAECLLAAAGDVPSMSECNRLKDVCEAAVDTPYDPGTFTTKGTTNVMSAVEEFVIQGVDLDNQAIDWLNLVELGDYIEFYQSSDGDSSLYEVIEEPKVFNTERSIRVKYLTETGLGDGKFNLQEEYEVRVIKTAQGIDLTEADKRYVIKPYVVYFADEASDITPQAPNGNLRNGELWFDTSSLQLFVWNNNAWVGASPPPSQDVTVAGVIEDVDMLLADAAEKSRVISSLVSDLIVENNIYYSDEAPTGDITGTLRNGDLWIDSDDLTIKFYSMGAWINPDRQVGGDYLEKTGGSITGELTFTKDRCNDVGCGPIHIAPGNTATSWSIRQDSADYLNFDANVGTYNEVIWFAPDGGATFSGQVELKKTATDDSHAANKKYVDDRIAELEARITALGG